MNLDVDLRAQQPPRSWFVRALANGVAFSMLGVVLGVVLPMALALVGFAGSFLPGREPASPALVSGFLSKVYGRHPERVMTIVLIVCVICFFLGISSTPALKTPRQKSDKRKIIGFGAVANTFLLPLAAPLCTGQTYLDGMALGLFIGLPITLLCCPGFYDKEENSFNESGKCHSVLYWLWKKYMK